MDLVLPAGRPINPPVRSADTACRNKSVTGPFLRPIISTRLAAMFNVHPRLVLEAPSADLSDHQGHCPAPQAFGPQSGWFFEGIAGNDSTILRNCRQDNWWKRDRQAGGRVCGVWRCVCVHAFSGGITLWPQDRARQNCLTGYPAAFGVTLRQGC